MAGFQPTELNSQSDWLSKMATADPNMQVHKRIENRIYFRLGGELRLRQFSPQAIRSLLISGMRLQRSRIQTCSLGACHYTL